MVTGPTDIATATRGSPAGVVPTGTLLSAVFRIGADPSSRSSSGAFVAREGYYSAQPENARKFLTEAEWDYWYGGKPAAADVVDPYGKLVEKAGRSRDGGSFDQRMGNIAVWNSVMDEDRYLTRKWNEFITS